MTVTEADLARIVVAHLEQIGADVYQEVDCSSGVADIVARVGPELWIIEVKVSASLALIQQGRARRRSAHRVILAIPHLRGALDFCDLCRELGLGLWVVRPDMGVDERERSQRWNRRPVRLAANLRPEHKTHAQAGTPCAAGRWTRYRSTCEQLARVVAGTPGIALRDAIAEVAHHYSSASSARHTLAQRIRSALVPGVRIDDEARLWPRCDE